MKKLPFLTLTLWLSAIALMPTPSYGQSGLNVKPASAKPQVKTNVPICYLQTSDGHIVDLSETCGFVQPTICGLSSSDPARTAALTNFCQQNQQCLLTQTCDQTPEPQTPTHTNAPVVHLMSDRLLSSIQLLRN